MASFLISATAVMNDYVFAQPEDMETLGETMSITVGGSEASEAHVGDTVTVSFTSSERGLIAAGYEADGTPQTLAVTDASRAFGEDGFVTAFTFTMPAADVTLTAAAMYTVTLDPEIMCGAVVVTPPVAFTNEFNESPVVGLAAEGETVALLALPEPSCDLTEWVILYGDGETAEVSDGCFAMPASGVTVKALFEEKLMHGFLDVSELLELDDYAALDVAVSNGERAFTTLSETGYLEFPIEPGETVTIKLGGVDAEKLAALSFGVTYYGPEDGADWSTGAAMDSETCAITVTAPTQTYLSEAGHAFESFIVKLFAGMHGQG